MPSIRCPKCETKLKIDAKQAGQAITCPMCFQKVRVPELKKDAKEGTAEGTALGSSTETHALPQPARHPKRPRPEHAGKGKAADNAHQKKVMGAVGAVWGLGMIIFSLTTRFGADAFSVVQVLGLVLGLGLLVLGGVYFFGN